MRLIERLLGVGRRNVAAAATQQADLAATRMRDAADALSLELDRLTWPADRLAQRRKHRF